MLWGRAVRTCRRRWVPISRLVVAVRVAAPCSKLGFADRRATPAGDGSLKCLPPRRPSAFLGGDGRGVRAELVEIEPRIVAGMVETFAVDCSGLG